MSQVLQENEEIALFDDSDGPEVKTQARPRCGRPESTNQPLKRMPKW